jgi:uncharacterized protein (DUF1330 family)
MAAYIIAEHQITDPAKFEEYRTKVGPMIAKHGGRYLTKAGSHVILEKEKAVWQPERVVIIEFPDMAALNAWYQSPEYQPLIALRQAAAIDMLITVEGVNEAIRSPRRRARAASAGFRGRGPSRSSG